MADGRRVSAKSRSRHSPSRSATMGCRPRRVRSSTGVSSLPASAPSAVSGRNVNQLVPPSPWPSVPRTPTVTRATDGGTVAILSWIRAARSSGPSLASGPRGEAT